MPAAVRRPFSHRSRRSRRALPLGLFVALATGGLSFAHIPQYLAGTRSTVQFFEDRVEILFDLSYRGIWAHSEMLSADEDRDSVVSRAEADRYLERQWRRKILKLNEKGERITRPALRCRLDGEEVPLELAKSEHEELVGEAYPGPFALYYTVRIPAPEGGFGDGKEHELELVDLVLDGEIPGKPRLCIPFRGHSNEPNRYRVRTEFSVPPPEEVLADGLSEVYFTESDRFVLRFRFLERVGTAGEDGEDASEGSAAGGADLELPGATSFPPSVAPPPEIESTISRKLPEDASDATRGDEFGDEIDGEIDEDDALLAGELTIEDDLSPPPELSPSVDTMPRSGHGSIPSAEGGSHAATRASDTPPRSARDEAESSGRLAAWEERASSFFAGFLSSPTRLGLGAIAGYLLLAFLYGAGHAFTPGHGKTMVAAYLLGSRGRIRDAFVLGLATTLTHTLTIYTVGVITLYLSYRFAVSDQAAAQRVSLWMSILSGALLVALGLAIYFRRALALDRSTAPAHGHSHRHAGTRSHASERQVAGAATASLPASDARSAAQESDLAPAHGDAHLAPRSVAPRAPEATGATLAMSDEPPPVAAPERPRLYELLALGISGGLLPCPAAIFVILVALQSPARLGLGLSGLLLFGVGLGSVLVLTGVLLVTGKSLATGKLHTGAFLEEIPLLRRIFGRSVLARGDRAGRWLLRVLPIASCLFIAALGAFFVARACVLGTTELRATLHWLGL